MNFNKFTIKSQEVVQRAVELLLKMVNKPLNAAFIESRYRKRRKCGAVSVW